jgi:hypothetical protein
MGIVAVDRTRGYIGLRVGCSKLNIFGEGPWIRAGTKDRGDAVVGFRFHCVPASWARSVMFLNGAGCGPYGLLFKGHS